MKPALLCLVLMLTMIPITSVNGDDTMGASIEEVKQKYTEELMSRPGVISVGIGLDDDGRAAIIVGIDKDVTPGDANIPPQLDGYRVITRVIGSPRVQ